MGRGGARAGAGRKPGQASRKTREIADRAAADGVTPLEVMLKAMREHYAKDELDAAAAIAKDAAPYMHPRLSSIEHAGRIDSRVEAVDARDRIAHLVDSEATAIGASEGSRTAH